MITFTKKRFYTLVLADYAIWFTIGFAVAKFIG